MISNWSAICSTCRCSPIGRFDGFSHIEQYLLSALRYQLNYTNYALAQAQYNYTPAFTGYLTEAQANTIEKMRDNKVWGYWAHECLVGYQRWDPDPIKFANVMYTWGYPRFVDILTGRAIPGRRGCTHGCKEKELHPEVPCRGCASGDRYRAHDR
jgi:hypothetical protein